jgi:hypothetical protein
MGSSAGAASPVEVAAVVSDRGDRGDCGDRGDWGDRGVGSSGGRLGLSVVEVEPRCRVGLTGSSVWVCPVGAGPACGRRGRAAGSGSPFGSGCVRSWAGGLSGSCTGWVTSVEMVSGLSAAASAPDVEDARTSPKRPARSAPIRTRPSSTRRPSGWSGFAFLRARAAAVRGRALAPPVGFGRLGGVRPEAVMGSSTGPAFSSGAAAAGVSGRGGRGAWGDWGVRLFAGGLGVWVVVVEGVPRRRVGLTGSWPFGSGCVRSWVGRSSGSRAGWVRPSWSGFAFLRARAAAVRGRALAPPVGFGRVGGVSAEAAMASSTCAAPSDAAAPAVFDRRNRGAWGDRGVRLSAVGLGVPAVVVGVEPRRRADGAPRRLSGPCGPPCDGDDTDVLCSAPDAGTRRASRCRGCARSRPRSAVATGRPLVGAGSAGVVPS